MGHLDGGWCEQERSGAMALGGKGNRRRLLLLADAPRIWPPVARGAALVGGPTGMRQGRVAWSGQKQRGPNGCRAWF
jgi:hypothetical protein